MVRAQSDFFVQLTVHRLLRRFAVLDAPLRELPGVFAYPLAPEDLVARVDQDDADVRAVAFTIEHDGYLEIN